MAMTMRKIVIAGIGGYSNSPWVNYKEATGISPANRASNSSTNTNFNFFSHTNLSRGMRITVPKFKLLVGLGDSKFKIPLPNSTVNC